MSREDGCFADKGVVSREGGDGQGGGAVGRGSDRIEGVKQLLVHEWSEPSYFGLESMKRSMTS